MAQVGPSSLCSTTGTPARHRTETTQGRRRFLGAFPTLSGSLPLLARAASAGSGFDQGHGDCVDVFDFIVPTQWRKCNTDTACLGCPVIYLCIYRGPSAGYAPVGFAFNPFLPF